MFKPKTRGLTKGDLKRCPFRRNGLSWSRRRNLSRSAAMSRRPPDHPMHEAKPLFVKTSAMSLLYSALALKEDRGHTFFATILAASSMTLPLHSLPTKKIFRSPDLYRGRRNHPECYTDCIKNAVMDLRFDSYRHHGQGERLSSSDLHPVIVFT